MKNALLLVLTSFSLVSCQKFIDKKVDEAATAVIVGQWKVTSFTKGGESKTVLFSPYTFQFQSNETVDAIKNGAVEKTGSWKVDVATRSIISNFSGVSEPLSLLNGTYHINNSSSTTVDASQTVNGEVWVLHLDKQ